MNDNIIEANRIFFAYEEGAKPALNGASLDVARGRFIAVLGYNGSGKSTLAKHLNAILVPSGGKVTVEGMDTADPENMLPIRQKVGMVFQNPDNQIVATVVEEDVAFGPENLGLPPAEIRERVDDALEAVGMTKRARSAPHKLSGGQKQRVAIAGVLAMRPDCIVLDEPTAMLDPVGRKKVMRTIKKLNKEENITVVLITHYMEEAAEADEVVVMSAGKVELTGTPKQVFGNPARMRELQLDVPQVTELCELLREGGVSIPGDIISVAECADALEPLIKENR